MAKSKQIPFEESREVFRILQGSIELGGTPSRGASRCSISKQLYRRFNVTSRGELRSHQNDTIAHRQLPRMGYAEF